MALRASVVEFRGWLKDCFLDLLHHLQMPFISPSHHYFPTPATFRDGSTKMASDNIVNQRADSSKSLYQICLTLRQRLNNVPGFEPHLKETQEEDVTEHEQIDPVMSLWRCFKKGYPLMTIYNALNPPEPLEVDEAKVPEARRAKTAAFKFVQACLKDLRFPPDGCFLIVDLYGEDTTGFVKVTRVVNQVIDMLESKDLLIPRDINNATDVPVDKSTEKRSYRENVVAELVNTERKYVQDLEALLNFKLTVEEKGVVTGDTIHTIFLNLNSLLDFQRRFLIRIETNNSLPQEQQRWGQAFANSQEGFRGYQPFIANQSRGERMALLEFEKLKLANHEMTADSTTLNAFLLKPMQRLVKYPQLLENLIKDAHKSENPDEAQLQDLEMGLQLATDALSNANEAVDREERNAALDELAIRVEDWKRHRIEQFGDLLMFGAFSVIKGDGRNDVEREVRITPADSISPLRSVYKSVENLHSSSSYAPAPESPADHPNLASTELYQTGSGSSSSGTPITSPAGKISARSSRDHAQNRRHMANEKSELSDIYEFPVPNHPEHPFNKPSESPKSSRSERKDSKSSGTPLNLHNKDQALGSQTWPLGSYASYSSNTPPYMSTATLVKGKSNGAGHVDPSTPIGSEPDKPQSRGARLFSFSRGSSNVPPEGAEEADFDSKSPFLKYAAFLHIHGHRTASGMTVLEETYANQRGITRPRLEQYKIYLFDKILLCCKEFNPNKPKNKVMGINKPTAAKKGKPGLLLKGRIFMCNVTETLSLQKPGSYTIQIWWKGDIGVENFIIRFNNEETMKKWYNMVEKQRKANKGKSMSHGKTSDTEFAWQKSHPITNPYQQEEDLDDDDGGMGSHERPSYSTMSEFAISRNASSTSLRSRSTTGESGPPQLQPNMRAAPPRFPMNFGSNSSLTLQTQMPTSAPYNTANESFFSPSAESPMSTRANSSMFPFPRQETPNNMRHGDEQNRFTAPAMVHTIPRDGHTPPNGYYAANGRASQRPSIAPTSGISAQQASQGLSQNRMRSASSPDIHNPLASARRSGQNGSISQPPVPPFPAHMSHMSHVNMHNGQFINRSQNNSPTVPPTTLPLRAATQSPGVQRERQAMATTYTHHHHQNHSGHFEHHQPHSSRMDPRTTMSSANTTPIPMAHPNDLINPNTSISSTNSANQMNSGTLTQSASHASLPNPAQLKVKVSYLENYVTLVVQLNISYQMLVDRIDAKLARFTASAIGRNTIRLRYRDEDNDFVTIRGDEDIQIAFSDWREQQIGRPNGQVGLGEICLYCVPTNGSE
ncbi:MAG: hypothetical protein M1829_003302 [Trizodia sp. TS-e1964]|nr:MAG: hypothetical protein M1829_003302 [Trizodia sp. TS-e1964]